MKQKSFYRAIIMMLTGGILYFLLEIIWRGYSHVSMFFLGGACFGMIGEIDRNYTSPIFLQMFCGAISITGLEFLTGVIVNIWMGLGVWNYWDEPFNLIGQVCLLYSILWFFLSGICVILYRVLYQILFHA